MKNTEKQAVDIKDVNSKHDQIMDTLYADAYSKLPKPLLIAIAFQWAKDRIGDDITQQYELLIKVSKNYKKRITSKSKSA